MLNLRSRGLTVLNTDIWWNMLIKFSNQIGNSFAKIINTKINYYTELIHKFLIHTLRGQTVANIIEIFQNAYHMDLHFT